MEHSIETSNLKSKIEEYVFNITKQYDMYLDISCNLDVTEILKSLNVKIKQYSELLLDKIINYINVINEIFGIKYFVFIKCYKIIPTIPQFFIEIFFYFLYTKKEIRGIFIW